MKKNKPHFRIRVAIIEVGMGQVSAYTTELKTVDFPACASEMAAEKDYKKLGDYYFYQMRHFKKSKHLKGMMP